MESQGPNAIKTAANRDAEYEHAFAERFRSCLEHLQFAVTIAHSQDVPLANACYRPNLADTIDQLATWFEMQAAIHHKQKAKQGTAKEQDTR